MECCIWIIIVVAVYLFSRWYRRGFIPHFNSKYVFITGTDTGFGHKLALDLDILGVHVYAGCYTKDGMDLLKKKASDRLKTVPLDVSDQTSVEQAKIFVENDLPPGKQLWGVVNNAGILGNVTFELATIEEFQQLMEVNFLGSVRVVQAFSPLIKKSKGRIVQVTSVLGRVSAVVATYTCSKFAIQTYTDLLRRYMKRFGVKVSTIEPGFFKETKIMDETAWTTTLKRKFDALPDWKKLELGPDFAENEITSYRLALEKCFLLGKWNKMSMVTNSMIHALGAKHPKTRYVVGYETRICILFVEYAPDWLLDKLMEFVFWFACGRQLS